VYFGYFGRTDGSSEEDIASIFRVEVLAKQRREGTQKILLDR
jgi:hypothetical protein